MPVLHAFPSPVADDPASAAAQKVLPSHWNDAHTVLVDLATEVTNQLQAANLPTIADQRVLGNVSGAPSVPLELTGAQVKALIGLINLVTDITGQLANANLADMPGATIKGNALGSSQAPQDLTVAQTRTLLGLDATGTGAVDSVTADDGLTISPTTGDVVAGIDFDFPCVWTVIQTVKGLAPGWVVETTSTSSSLSDVGAYYASYNTTGLISAVGAHTSGYSNPGTVFLANQATFESYGNGGTAIGCWGAADLAVFMANGTVTPREAWRVKATGTTQFAAGSTAAGTAPIKFTSGSLMTAPEAGAVEFLTDKWYGTITTATSRKEFVLADTTLTAGRVVYGTTNGRVQDNANFLYDGTNNRLNIGGSSAAGNDIYVSKSTAGQCAVTIENTSGNAAAYAGGVFVNNAGANVVLLKLSSAYTTTGLVTASQNYMVGSTGSFLQGTAAAADWIVATNGTATTNERLRCDSNGNVSIGNAALATNATNGFLYIPTCAGTPTGVPTTKTGRVAMVFNTTGNTLHVYDGGWVTI